MVLSERERYIAWGLGGAVALLAINYFLWTPYSDRSQQLTVAVEKAKADRQEGQDLLDHQRRLRPVWAQMQAAGLNLDASLAESQAQHAVINWADSAGVKLTSIKPERQTQENDFQVIGFEVIGTGTTPSTSRLLYSMEGAAIPIRVNEVQVTSRKEGSDDLTLRLSVSVLCLPPSDDNNTNKSSAASSDAGSGTSAARSGT